MYSLAITAVGLLDVCVCVCVCMCATSKAVAPCEVGKKLRPCSESLVGERLLNHVLYQNVGPHNKGSKSNSCVKTWGVIKLHNVGVEEFDSFQGVVPNLMVVFFCPEDPK